MSYLTELHNTDTVITTNTEVTVENAVTEVLVDKENGYVAEAIPTNFTISSGGLYSGNLGGNAPQWLSDLVDSSVDATITDEYQTLLNTYETRIENTELGVAQEIVRAQNAEQSLSGLIASTKAELNGNISAVETIAASKVTPEEATNLIGTLVGSKWLAANEALAESYIDSRATTKVSEEFASNTTYNALVSSVNDPSTGLGATSAIQQESFTTVGLNPNGTLNAGAGELGRISASVNGLETTLTTVDTVNVNGVNWSVGASKLAQGPNGAITGWSFSDGSALNSEFKVSADKFSLVNANGTATPLIVDATDPNNVQMEFTGKVTLAGLGIDSNTTTIDGGKITTGKIQSADTNTYFDLANNQIKMDNGDGFVLDSTAAGTSTAPNIQGGYIKGAQIQGGSIASDTTITADSITTGTLNADRIVSGSLTSSSILNISGSTTANRFLVGSIYSNNPVGVSTLTGINLSLGTGAGSVRATIQVYRGGTLILTEYVSYHGNGYFSTSIIQPAGNYVYSVYAQAFYSNELDAPTNMNASGTLAVVEFKK